MTTDLQKTGNDVLGDVPWGTHFCCFYETPEDLLDVVVPYFTAGLKNKEFCLWVISNSELLTVEEAMSALRKAVPDLDRYFAEKSIEVVSHDDWFLDGDRFDPQRVASRFKQRLDGALSRGYVGMRANGSPAWLSGHGQSELHVFEEELSDVFRNERILGFCTYALAATGGDEVFDVVRTHQHAIARRRGKWETIETPELSALRKTSEQLRALSAHQQSAREQEAARIAREIHDQLGSALASLKWDIDEMENIVKEKTHAMTLTVDGIWDAVGRIAAELRPRVLDDLGLVPAIEWQARQFQARTGIVCHCQCSLEKGDLTPAQSTAVFRILQEALTNTLRHAHATRVDITVAKAAGEVIVTIGDNGRGIDEEKKSAPQSLGLLGMRERATLIGGRITIAGAKGQGTVIALRIPTVGSRK